VAITDRLEDAVRDADVVMLLRLQMERQQAGLFPAVREYRHRYGIDLDKMHLLPEHAIIMHPGPINRGIELASNVADGPRSIILDQVTNGVAVRMAVLYLLGGGE
jgi:aspartate carbamoyltransferase catalytic subunit